MMIGQTVSHYRILELIGGGGMGVVYRARDLKLDRPVALKFLPPELTRDPEAKQRFIHEARSASILQHNNICVVYDIDEVAEDPARADSSLTGRMFMSMEYLEGETLRKRIERGPLTVPEAVDLALQVARGLDQAHRHGITHRDIKPANIMIKNDGVAKIVDFGLAKLGGGTMLTRAGTTLGTVAYMSPEQARGSDVDRRTDIWSVGVILYEMLAGKPPFTGEFEAGIIYSILNTEPARLSARVKGIDQNLEQIVSKALRKDPQERYQDIGELIADLVRFSSGAAAEPDAFGSRGHVWLSRRARWAIPAAAIAVAGAAYLILGPGWGTPDIVGPPPRESRPSIAVLPFDDLSSAKDQEYFCSGMAEELQTNLSRIPELRVVGGTSTAALKGKQLGIREIGRELGVETVLEGSLRKDAGHIRLTLRLTDAADGFTRWSDTYDREMKDLFSIQEDISRSVAAALKIALTPETAGYSIPRMTSHIDAYEYLLKGNHFVKLYLISYKERDFQSAVSMYTRAKAIDTTYALAYAGLAWAYEHHRVYGAHFAARASSGDRDQVIACVRRAYQLDSNSGPINAGMAYLAAQGKAYDQAYAFCKRAIVLDPNSLFVNHLVGTFLADAGLTIQAVKFFERAIELDPLYLLSLGEMASSLQRSGDYDRAADLYRRTLELSPDDLLYKVDYVRCLIETGKPDEAEALLRTVEKANPALRDISGCRALLLAARGSRLALKLDRSPELYALLGAKREAVESLEAVTASASTCRYLQLLRSPFYASLRNEPRFQALLAHQRGLYEDRMKKYGGL